jgi:hypothetical protein
MVCDVKIYHWFSKRTIFLAGNGNHKIHPGANPTTAEFNSSVVVD